MQSYDEIAMQSLDFADLNPPFKLSQRIYTIHKNGQTLPLGSGNPRIHGKITSLFLNIFSQMTSQGQNLVVLL
jgi:hypothetical protein